MHLVAPELDHKRPFYYDVVERKRLPLLRQVREL